MNDNASAEPQVNVAPQVFAEQVAILHRHSSLSLVTTAIAALLVVMLLYDAVPLAQTASWAAAMLATTALRGVIVQRYRAAAGQGRSTQTWMRDFCVGLSATSILWGVAAAAFLTTPSISARFGLLTILAVIRHCRFRRSAATALRSACSCFPCWCRWQSPCFVSATTFTSRLRSRPQSMAPCYG